MTDRFFSTLRRARTRRAPAWGLAALLAVALASPALPAGGPERIVSLVPAITETLFALGVGPRVVGVSTYCDHPDAARSLPKVGTFTEPVAEVIVSLAPDLVLTSPSPGNESAVRAIERTGVTVAVVQSEGALAEARTAMREVAEAVGEPEAGRRLLESIDARFAAVARVVASVPQAERPKVAVVIGREPVVLAGPDSYLGELLVLAGGLNVADDVGGRWPRVGLEFLVQSSPDVLVDLSVSMGGGTKAAPSWSALSSLPAVTGGRVVVDVDSVMLRPGPRIADAAEALLAACHPGLVPAGVGALP